MTIDFTLSPELEEIRVKIRNFINTEVKPVEETIERDKLDQTDRDQYISLLVGMRKKALSPKDHGFHTCQRTGWNGSRACRISNGPS